MELIIKPASDNRIITTTWSFLALAMLFKQSTLSTEKLVSFKTNTTCESHNVGIKVAVTNYSSGAS